MKVKWSWRVKYPRYARLIYRLLALKTPIQNLGERLSSSNEPESEGVELTTLHNIEEDSTHVIRKTQAWTVVHSYFVQMGGLAYVDEWDVRHDDYTRAHRYFVLTASKLSTRYIWHDNHPLQHLVLGKDDIEDKSKADSFVKSIAVFQIAWLVLNVIAHAIKKLPITQLEIATIAFALMAILTYATNWWKPKDVSRPIRLLCSCSGRPQYDNDDAKELMQSFMIRLRQPHKAEKNSRDISDIERVPNDWVWMEGQTPLFYHLLGTTSLVFGSLHCIAWNFEFPTRIELLCWRAASLLSATLPALALGLSLGMSYLRVDYLGRKRTTILLHLLEPFESISDEKWKHLFEPQFSQWNRDAIEALMAMPKDSDTNWEVEPSQGIIEELRDAERHMDRSEPCLNFIEALRDVHYKWAVSPCKGSRHIQFGEELCREIGKMTGIIDLCSRGYDFQNFWHQYERFVERKLGISPGDRFETSCLDTIMKANEEINAKVNKLESRLDLVMKMVEALNGCGGIIYIACRLMTIVLLFTCLRAAPSGVYQEVLWTTFIPGIS